MTSAPAQHPPDQPYEDQLPRSERNLFEVASLASSPFDLPGARDDDPDDPALIRPQRRRRSRQRTLALAGRRLLQAVTARLQPEPVAAAGPVDAWDQPAVVRAPRPFGVIPRAIALGLLLLMAVSVISIAVGGRHDTESVAPARPRTTSSASLRPVTPIAARIDRLRAGQFPPARTAHAAERAPRQLRAKHARGDRSRQRRHRSAHRHHAPATHARARAATAPRAVAPAPPAGAAAPPPTGHRSQTSHEFGIEG